MPTLRGFARAPIPGPKALPLIGVHVNGARLLSDPIGGLTKLRKLGDIVSIAEGSPAVVCAFGPERNREVLGQPAVFDNEDEFLMPAPPGSGISKMKNALVFLAGDTHKRHRRLMMPAFQKAAIDGYAPAIVEVTEQVLRGWPVGSTADVADLTRDLVQHVAVRTLFGLPWSDEDHTLGELASEVVDLMTSPAAPLFPFNLPGTPYRRLLTVSQAMTDLLLHLIQEKRRLPPGRDALSLIVHAKDEDHPALTDDELIGEAGTLFVAGYDTQARTLGWTLFLLAQHPPVLAALVDEIDAVLRGAPPSADHVARMPLLDRVIKESMRILSAAPVLFLRSVRSPAKLGPYELPAKASVVLSPFVTHREPEVYTDPARFRPERWEKLTPTLHEYMPFGSGPRMCIGATFATLALRLMLPMILQRFRFTVAHGATISRLVRGNILHPRHGLPMLVAPQDRHFTKRATIRGDVLELLDLS